MRNLSILGIKNMIPRTMLGYTLRESVAEDIFKLQIRIRNLVYLDRKYLWAGS